LAALASHGVEVRLAPDGRLIVRGRAPRPTALLAEARKRAKALAELLRQRAAISPPKEEASEHPPKEVISGRVAAGFDFFQGKTPNLQPAATSDCPKTQAEVEPEKLRWPSWMQAFQRRLEQAKLEPRLMVARGHRGVPVLSIEATCPSCGWVGGLVAWPWSSGLVFARCRAGCSSKEVFHALDKLLQRR
jgi:hypothetical protein